MRNVCACSDSASVHPRSVTQAYQQLGRSVPFDLYIHNVFLRNNDATKPLQRDRQHTIAFRVHTALLMAQQGGSDIIRQLPAEMQQIRYTCSQVGQNTHVQEVSDMNKN